MRIFVVAALILALVGVPAAAAQSCLSFALEFCAGAVAAAVPFYAVLLRPSGTPQPFQPSRSDAPSLEDLVLGLAVPPLAAGEAVACLGSLFGVAGPNAGLAAILGASVGEIFALQLWQLDIPEWAKTLAVPIITSLGATIAFSRQTSASY